MRCCSLLLLLMPIACGAEYRVGVARIDITPPAGHAMGGYEARKHGFEKVHRIPVRPRPPRSKGGRLV